MHGTCFFMHLASNEKEIPCRLRVSLSAAHMTADVDALVAALSTCTFQSPKLQFLAKL